MTKTKNTQAPVLKYNVELHVGSHQNADGTRKTPMCAFEMDAPLPGIIAISTEEENIYFTYATSFERTDADKTRVYIYVRTACIFVEW